MKTFIQKLVRVQCDLKAKKSQWNDFGKYHYRKAEDILEALKPLLKEEGLFLTLSDGIELVGGRFYIKCTASITDGEAVQSVIGYAREEETKKGMDGSQITGAASSYARKYALNGLFGIDDTADSDSTNDHGKSPDQGSKATSPATPTKTDQPKTPAKTNTSTGSVLLSKKDKENPERWGKVVKWLKDNNKVETDWPAIKEKGGYLITEAEEKELFEELDWLTF